MKPASAASFAEPAPRAVDWYRVAEIVAPRGPFSKPTIFRLIANGDLETRHVGKILLISGASLRHLMGDK